MFSKPKHLLFAPVYLHQGTLIRRQTVSLPEPDGARHGFLSINNKENTTCHSDNYQLLVIGDSSAAGVGVAHQQQAVTVKLLAKLSQKAAAFHQYQGIEWQLHATTGHDSFDVLRRLYTLPQMKQPLDMLIIVVGVNDVTKMRSVDTWQKNLAEIITIANHKFSPENIIFSAVPPMEKFPALPYPLNDFMGTKADELRAIMKAFCDTTDNIHYADFDFLTPSSQIKKSNFADYFADDGFHPNELMYELWAEQLAEVVVDIERV